MAAMFVTFGVGEKEGRLRTVGMSSEAIAAFGDRRTANWVTADLSRAQDDKYSV